MTTVNEPNRKLDTTVKIFDRFYLYETEVDSNEYDAVNSYFLSVFRTKQAADNFSVTLFRIADETGIPVLTLLNQIAGLNDIELTAAMAYYLNGLRSPATLLGILEPVTPNYYTARNVLP